MGVITFTEANGAFYDAASEGMIVVVFKDLSVGVHRLHENKYVGGKMELKMIDAGIERDDELRKALKTNETEAV